MSATKKPKAQITKGPEGYGLQILTPFGECLAWRPVKRGRKHYCVKTERDAMEYARDMGWELVHA